MTVKTQLCLCNIQGVGVCTNVSANYMFQPFPVRPSSGWTYRSEEIHNNAKLSLKSGGGTRSRLQNLGRVCADWWYWNIYIVVSSLWQFIYPLLVGSGILYCWSVVVGMAGCDNGPLLGPCGHSKLHPPPQACCVEKGYPLWCWYVRSVFY